MEKLLSKISNKQLKLLALSIFFLQPLLELDYLLVDYLGPIPRPSTVFHLIIIPLIVLLVFLKKDQKKKSTAIMALSYLLVLGIYFILHSKNCVAIYDSLYLTTNFKFSWFGEFVYIYTLVIPYFMIYSFYKAEIDQKMIDKYIVWISLALSVLIIAGDLFGFGLSTYSPKYTVDSIFCWFTNDPEVIHPRDLSSKFYFPEGNTLGIYLFALLPLLYCLLAKATETKEKVELVLAIILQSLAMIIVSTRVGTYGTILIPAASLAVYVLFLALKNVKFNIWLIVTSIVMAALFAFLLPYTPAYVNQQLDNRNDVAVLNDNYLLEMAKKGNNDEALVPGTVEYNYYYMHYFEDWGIKTNLISSVSKEYYTLYYTYKFDAKFWWDVLDLYPLEERCNGRQIQTIFNNYKWNGTDTKTKVMGMGYTTIMNGSFLIERDFVQQRYTLGYLGDALTLTPWALICLYGVYKILRDFKHKFNFENVMYAMAFLAILGASYMSGHTLDQYLTTGLLALISMVLLKRVNANE